MHLKKANGVGFLGITNKLQDVVLQLNKKEQKTLWEAKQIIDEIREHLAEPTGEAPDDYQLDTDLALGSWAIEEIFNNKGQILVIEGEWV